MNVKQAQEDMGGGKGETGAHGGLCQPRTQHGLCRRTGWEGWQVFLKGIWEAPATPHHCRGCQEHPVPAAPAGVLWLPWAQAGGGLQGRSVSVGIYLQASVMVVWGLQRLWHTEVVLSQWTGAGEAQAL